MKEAQQLQQGSAGLEIRAGPVLRWAENSQVLRGRARRQVASLAENSFRLSELVRPLCHIVVDQPAIDCALFRWWSRSVRTMIIFDIDAEILGVGYKYY